MRDSVRTVEQAGGPDGPDRRSIVLSVFFITRWQRRSSFGGDSLHYLPSTPFVDVVVYCAPLSCCILPIFSSEVCIILCFFSGRFVTKGLEFIFFLLILYWSVTWLVIKPRLRCNGMVR